MNIHVANYWWMTHIIYKDLLDHPPKGISYTPIYPYWFYFKKKILGAKNAAIEVSGKNISFIHSFGQVLSTKVEWIASLEHYFVFSEHDFSYLKNKKYKENIKSLILADNCRRIYALTNTARERIIQYFDEDPDIKSKISTIYPAIRFEEISRPRKLTGGPITILFIANADYYMKGGSEALRAFQIISARRAGTFRLIFKCSNIPVEEQSLCDDPNITIIDKQLPYARIKELFAASDIFLFPVLKSSFASFLEAMNAGLPIVTGGTFEVPEIVRHKKNGIVVPITFGLLDNLSKYNNNNEYRQFIATHRHSDFVEGLVDGIEQLVDSERLYHSISGNNIEDTTSGRFSYKRRNADYRRAYLQYNKSAL